MKLGLLWYDADQRLSPQARLAEAASRFAEKFGRAANCCHVNPDDLFADQVISVVADPTILKHHFWVGRDEALEPERPRRKRKMAASATPPEPPAVAEILAPLPIDEVPVESAAPTDATVEGPANVSIPSVADAPAEVRRRRRTSARRDQDSDPPVAQHDVAVSRDRSAKPAAAAVPNADEGRTARDLAASTTTGGRKPRRRPAESVLEATTAATPSPKRRKARQNASQEPAPPLAAPTPVRPRASKKAVPSPLPSPKSPAPTPKRRRSSLPVAVSESPPPKPSKRQPAARSAAATPAPDPAPAETAPRRARSRPAQAREPKPAVPCRY